MSAVFDCVAAVLDQVAAGIGAMFVFSAVQGALFVLALGVAVMSLAAIVIMVTVVYGRRAGRRCIRVLLLGLGLLFLLLVLAALLGWSSVPPGVPGP